MKWKIEYYNNDVSKTILSLPKGLLARYLRLTDLMLIHGANLGIPHTKYIENGLFELRLKSKEGIGRVFYCVVFEKRIVMLHSFIKKSQKTPKKELQIALNRLKEIKNDS